MRHAVIIGAGMAAAFWLATRPEEAEALAGDALTVLGLADAPPQDYAPDDGGLIDLAYGLYGSFGTMQLSEQGIAAIKRREGGFRAVAYRDAGGWSIGYGHFIQPGESFGTISEQTGAALLRNDLAAAERAVSANISAPLNQSQYDALVSFAFNAGAGALRKSALKTKLNALDYDGAADEFARWNKSRDASGVLHVNAVLVIRRADERAQFEGIA